MKHFIFKPLILLALSTSYAAAAPSPAGQRTSAAQVSQALNQIDDLMALGQSTAQSLEDLEDLVDAMPTTASMRARMGRYVQDLQRRAAEAFLDQTHVAELRQSFVETRLDHAMDRLEKRAQGGEWSKEQFFRVLNAWTARAHVFTDAPDPAAYRARVQSTIASAAARATSLNEAMRSVRLQLLQGRLEQARQLLLKRIAASNVSRADYFRIYELMIRRARVIHSQSFPE